MLGSRVLLAAALLGAPAPRFARAEAAPSEGAAGVENEKALQTFKEGIAAFDRRDFEAARVAFLQTFALKPSAPVVRRNLGLAEIYSGHYLDGARRLGRVIHMTDEGTSVDRARMVESLKKAEAHLERVTVEVNVEGAEIRIGDVDLGVSPLPFAWYLEPGAYDVRVSKPGFTAFTETRLARAGSAQHLRVHLIPLGALEEPLPAPDLQPAAPQPAPELERGANPWLLLAGSALTAGGLVAGLTLSLFAADNEDKADSLKAGLGDTNCRGSTSSACMSLADTAVAHDRQLRWATVSFALGAVAGVSTIIYAIVASAGHAGPDAMAQPVSSSQRLGVSAGTNGMQLVIDGSF
jgi:hypothetical protein